jgi:hypothetical protein
MRSHERKVTKISDAKEQVVDMTIKHRVQEAQFHMA